jgi:cell division protein YceG involved in septum cleavage
MILIGSAESFTHSRVSDDISSIEVKKGSSLNSILNNFSLNLYEIFLLKIFLKFNDIEMIQAGFYDLNNLSWRDFLKSLSEGKVKIFKLEIPEGKNLYEIEDILARSSLTNDCFNFDCLKKFSSIYRGYFKAGYIFLPTCRIEFNNSSKISIRISSLI